MPEQQQTTSDTSARAAASVMARAQWAGVPHDERVRITAARRAAAVRARKRQAEVRRAGRALNDLTPIVEAAIADGRLPRRPTVAVWARIAEMIGSAAASRDDRGAACSDAA